MFSYHRPETLDRKSSQMVKIMEEEGGAIMTTEWGVKVLRSSYIKDGVDYPFLLIPQK